MSVGEINSIRNLITLLYQEYEIVLTTTTTTAHKILSDQFSKNILFHGYFPWDFWLFSQTAWRRIQPDAIILIDSELWPEHLTQANKRKVPVFLINARLSDHSFRLYQYFTKFAHWIFRKIDFIVACSKENQKRIASFSCEKIENFGNLKFDIPIKQLSATERKQLKQELGFNKNAFIMMGCSTWPGEEALLLQVFQKIRQKQNTGMGQKLGLLLVPRHAERRHELISWLEKEPLSFNLRSKGISPKEVDICLADTTGELSRLIQVADLAYIGKSLAPHEGGQSPLDAAMAGIPIVYGNRMTNFRDICMQMEQENAAVKVNDQEEAINTLVTLSEDFQKRQILAENIHTWFKRNQGASAKTYYFIRKQLKHF